MNTFLLGFLGIFSGILSAYFFDPSLFDIWGYSFTFSSFAPAIVFGILLAVYFYRFDEEGEYVWVPASLLVAFSVIAFFVAQIAFGITFRILGSFVDARTVDHASSLIFGFSTSFSGAFALLLGLRFTLYKKLSFLNIIILSVLGGLAGTVSFAFLILDEPDPLIMLVSQFVERGSLDIPLGWLEDTFSSPTLFIMWQVVIASGLGFILDWKKR